MALSALFSTGSAINATLFSAGHFAKGLLSEGLLPDRVGDADVDGVPERTLLGLGVVTSAFTVAGTLSAITNFASVAFIVVFGAMSYLAFTQRSHDDVSALPPAVGAVGAAGFLPLLLWHLYSATPRTFAMVCVVAVELLYFERDVLAEEVTAVEDSVESAFD